MIDSYTSLQPHFYRVNLQHSICKHVFSVVVENSVEQYSGCWHVGEGSGSVVECLTRDRGVGCSSLTSVTVLCP